MNYFGTETIEFTRSELFRILFALEKDLEYYKKGFWPGEVKSIESSLLKVNTAINRIDERDSK
ncbi:hypothetical protein ABH897_005585 [Paenibacillus sp. RC73]|uniref:hypothetical protein n=1 Tax=Paenibacillus sp. RC73 TaxID=3156250 RepID=UPI003832C5AA